MSSPVLTIAADADLHDAFGIFRSHGVRRLAVTRDQQFIGMITIDDLLIDLAADLSDIARPISAEVILATTMRRCRTLCNGEGVGREEEDEGHSAQMVPD